MWACMTNSDKVLEVIFAHSPMIGLDFNAKSSAPPFAFSRGSTGFIQACMSKSERAVDLILANYQRLKIDLKIKDDYGRTGMDIWPEKFRDMIIEDV